MKEYRLAGWGILLLAMSWVSCYGHAAQTDPNEPPPTPAQEQPEVLAGGPVHEAFAAPVSLELQAGLLAPSQPPANIEEAPPSDRPQGENFVWVPGYWSWDASRNSYIWVSACWRVAPPQMSWVPGYWGQATGGWEWVAGYWAPVGVQEIEYLPAPPASDDVLAIGLAPSPNHTWVPGCWYWHQGQYVRRSGYWLAGYAGWVWEPSHYLWTPRGCIFAAGHWDYALESRGVLFAPVYFQRSIYERAGFRYSPSIVVDLGVLTVHLFAYPRYCHYYFGDYYEDSYVHMGIYPRHDRSRNHTWYDPIYEYDRSRFSRTRPRWEDEQRDEYNHYRADKNLRPARTYREMEIRVAKLPEAQRRKVQMAQPLTVVVNSVNVVSNNSKAATSMKFETIKPEAQRAIAKQAADDNKFREERKGWETVAQAPKASQPITPVKEPKHSVAVPGGPKEPVTPSKEVRPSKVTPPKKPKPTPASAEPKSRPGPSTEREAPFVAPRQVQVTKPERVKIPAPPISSRAAVKENPPARPVSEEKPNADPAPKESHKADRAPKESRKDDRDRKGNAGGKDSRKDDDDSKGKR